MRREHRLRWNPKKSEGRSDRCSGVEDLDQSRISSMAGARALAVVESQETSAGGNGRRSGMAAIGPPRVWSIARKHALAVTAWWSSGPAARRSFQAGTVLLTLIPRKPSAGHGEAFRAHRIRLNRRLLGRRRFGIAPLDAGRGIGSRPADTRAHCTHPRSARELGSRSERTAIRAVTPPRPLPVRSCSATREQMSTGQGGGAGWSLCQRWLQRALYQRNPSAYGHRAPGLVAPCSTFGIRPGTTGDLRCQPGEHGSTAPSGLTFRLSRLDHLPQAFWVECGVGQCRARAAAVQTGP